MKAKLKSLCHSALRTLALAAAVAFVAPDATAAVTQVTPSISKTGTYTSASGTSGTEKLYSLAFVYTNAAAVKAAIKIEIFEGNTASGTAKWSYTKTFDSATKGLVGSFSNNLGLKPSTTYCCKVSTSTTNAKVDVGDFKWTQTTDIFENITSGTWDTANIWTLQNGSYHKVPGASDTAYIGASTVTSSYTVQVPLNTTAPGSLVVYAGKTAAVTYTLKGNGTGNKGSFNNIPRAVRWPFAQGNVVFDGITFNVTSGSTTAPHVAVLSNGGKPVTVTMKNDSTGPGLILWYYNIYDSDGVISFVDTTSEFYGLYGYDGPKAKQNNLTVDNSLVELHSYGYGASGITPSASATTTNKLCMTIKLGSKNNGASQAALRFSDKFVKTRNSTLAIDASAVTAGTYKIFSSAAPSGDGTVAINSLKLPDGTVVNPGIDLGSSKSETTTMNWKYTLSYTSNLLTLTLAENHDYYWVMGVTAHWDKVVDTTGASDYGKTYWAADANRSNRLTTYPCSYDAQIHLGSSSSTKTSPTFQEKRENSTSYGVFSLFRRLAFRFSTTS